MSDTTRSAGASQTVGSPCREPQGEGGCCPPEKPAATRAVPEVSWEEGVGTVPEGPSQSPSPAQALTLSGCAPSCHSIPLRFIHRFCQHHLGHYYYVSLDTREGEDHKVPKVTRLCVEGESQAARRAATGTAPTCQQGSRPAGRDSRASERPEASEP